MKNYREGDPNFKFIEGFNQRYTLMVSLRIPPPEETKYRAAPWLIPSGDSNAIVIVDPAQGSVLREQYPAVWEHIGARMPLQEAQLLQDKIAGILSQNSAEVDNRGRKFQEMLKAERTEYNQINRDKK